MEDKPDRSVLIAGCGYVGCRLGMLLQAQREFCLDLTRTWFVGDDPRDVEAGEAAGCKTVLVSEEKPLLDVLRSHVLAGTTGRPAQATPGAT